MADALERSVALKPRDDHEAVLARSAVRVVLALLVPMALVAWMLRGPGGAATAGGGVGLVAFTHLFMGLSLSAAVRGGPRMIQAVALGGFFVRLVIYVTLLVVLSPLDVVDGPVLAVSVAIATVVVLTLETRLVLREGSFWWLDVQADKDRA